MNSGCRQAFPPSLQEEAADAIIEILPTLKRVIPFQDIADWNRIAERYVAAAASVEAEEAGQQEEVDS